MTSMPTSIPGLNEGFQESAPNQENVASKNIEQGRMKSHIGG